MKIFNVSLHRSGTQSFHAFCQANAISSQHWPGHDFDASIRDADGALNRFTLWHAYAPLAEAHEACSDLPVPSLHEELHAAYPDALYLLVRRAPAAWRASVRRHMRDRNLANLERYLYWSLCPRQEETLAGYSDAELLAAYDVHNVRMASYFIRHHARFQVFFLEDPDMPARLAKFMGMPAAVAFPRVDAMAA